MPVCGGGDVAEASRIAAVPIWVFHGGKDNVVKTKRSRDMVAAIKAAGGKPKYTELPGVGHNAWGAAYGNSELWAWMFAQKRGGAKSVSVEKPLAVTGTVRVACVGDSITFGAGIRDRKNKAYPVQLGRLLGDGWEVRNFGVSGRTMLKKGDRPIWKEKKFNDALAFKPHVVVIKLGTNDTKPQNWKHKDEFAADTAAMVERFRSLDSEPRVYLCRPVPAFPARWGISDERIRKEVIPLIDRVGRQKKVPIIDLYTPLEGKKEFFPDKIHPNAEGAAVMAKLIADVLRKDVTRK